MLISMTPLIPITFDPGEIKQLLIGSSAEVTAWSLEQLDNIFATSEHPDIATTNAEPLIFSPYNASHYSASFNVVGVFLGYTSIHLQNSPSFNESLSKSPSLDVSIIREPGILDRIFIICVATLVSLIYVNFGCALDWGVIKETIKRPISPAIGFMSQFGFMPLMSFLLGRLLFPNNVSMQLGLFFTGCAPGGGASNIWTVALGGNLDLSITMTTISTFSSFGLLIPLLVGTLIQFYLPKVSAFMVKLMKPFAVFLIVFIVVFGTVANLYLFSLLDWRVIVAGLCIPWLGYMFGGTLAHFSRLNTRDVIAVAVETVCPVAVSLMTPIPLAILSLILRIRKCRLKNNLGAERLPSGELTTPSGEQADKQLSIIS
ncbi:hypothetical protein B566_EDAN001719 [Ephemera danica]|nr:hypothetical protein B566_EDAN001719 [Ephemera danica]